MKNSLSNNDNFELDDWESRKLGADEKYTRTASSEIQKSFDDSLGLQSISIRLQKDLIEILKIIAHTEGLGYQPLIRQILTRYVNDKKPDLQMKQENPFEIVITDDRHYITPANKKQIEADLKPQKKAK